MKTIALLLVTVGLNTFAQEINNKPFPDDFMWGVGSAAYQVEGAWDESDKGESVWDYLTHEYPEMVNDRSTGDIASDSYNHLDDDVDLLKQLGVNFYRFSISWSRVLPTGFSNRISTRGLRYYQDLIDTLIENGITPVVTMYHWDLPNDLQKLGGWMNSNIVKYFVDYAELLFTTFGNKVKYWITFDSPNEFCKGYGITNGAPAGLKLPGIGEYLCAATVLKAHAGAYHIYNDTFRERQNGQVGIAFAFTWHQPLATNTAIFVITRAIDFEVGIFADPIFTDNGDFPATVQARVTYRSIKEGYPESRLPVFTDDEIKYIKGTADFFGLNHFSSVMADTDNEAPFGASSVEADLGLTKWYDPSWDGSASTWLKVYPEGFKNTLAWIRGRFKAPILITANGFSDTGDLEDNARIKYHKLYLSALRDAMDAGANVIGYTAWTLLDGFEWLEGYTTRFGLFHVDFNDPGRPRTIKSSGEYYKRVIASKVVSPPNTTQA